MSKQKLSSKSKISIPFQEYKELIECRDRLLSRVFKDKRFIIMGNIFTEKHLKDIVPEEDFDDFRQYVHSVCSSGYIEGGDPEEFYTEFKQEQEEEEDERYCDNVDCPFGGYIYDEELEKYKGKEYICVGCKTGKGLQERELERISKDLP